MFKCDAEVGREVGRFADLAVCSQEFQRGRGCASNDIENGFHMGAAVTGQKEPIIDRFSEASPFEVQQGRDAAIIREPVPPMTICMDWNEGLRARRCSIGNRCQAIEQMAWHESGSVLVGQGLKLGKKRRLRHETAVIKRLSQCLLGVAGGDPLVHPLEPLDRIFDQRTRGRCAYTGHPHAGSCPQHARIAGIANLENSHSVEPAGEQRSGETARQLRYECHLSV